MGTIGTICTGTICTGTIGTIGKIGTIGGFTVTFSDGVGAISGGLCIDWNDWLNNGRVDTDSPLAALKGADCNEYLLGLVSTGIYFCVKISKENIYLTVLMSGRLEGYRCSILPMWNRQIEGSLIKRVSGKLGYSAGQIVPSCISSIFWFIASSETTKPKDHISTRDV